MEHDTFPNRTGHAPDSHLLSDGPPVRSHARDTMPDLFCRQRGIIMIGKSMPAYVIDLAFVERMLEMAERRIAEPTSSEALYREIADELERTEGDPKMARILLVTFTNSYAAHVTSGDRLRKLR